MQNMVGISVITKIPCETHIYRRKTYKPTQHSVYSVAEKTVIN